jgi:serine/threonine protein phosphatase 1
MGRIICAGDIHGAAKALEQCFERSKFDLDNDTLIQLGDIVDGYDEVYECVEQLLNVKNLIALKGNHCDWFEYWLRTGYHPDNWTQGGKATAKSYLRQIGSEDMISRSVNGYLVALNPEDIPSLHRQFFLMEQRLYYKDDENNIFVHGGFHRSVPIEENARLHSHDLFWNRDLWSQAKSCKNGGLKFSEDVNEVYIGHTACHGWRNPLALPLKEAQVWNLDTGAGSTGKLTFMDIHTKEYWQSDFVTELYPTKK